MKTKLKGFWVQLAIIMVLSLTIALAYNQLSKSPLPVLEKYKPQPVSDSGEDLSVYYDEMDVETLRALMEADMGLLLDARTTENYNNGHLPKAFSLPISEFSDKYEQTAGLLEEGKSIIIYCIGINCIDSSKLAKELHQKGHRDIYVYKGGIEEWQALGYPVEIPGEGGN